MVAMAAGVTKPQHGALTHAYVTELLRRIMGCYGVGWRLWVVRPSSHLQNAL